MTALAVDERELAPGEGVALFRGRDDKRRDASLGIVETEERRIVARRNARAANHRLGQCRKHLPLVVEDLHGRWKRSGV
jgi:hypothetical protein